MARYKYKIREILEYLRDITIETDMSEEELHEVLNTVERISDNAMDVADYLIERGVKVIEHPDSDFSSPVECSIEGWDLIKEEEEV